MKFLGIDVGTGGSRAVVIDEAGSVVASASASHLDYSSPEIGWAEQDPNDWWHASKVVIREILQSISAEEIASVSFSGQMHGSVFLDSSDLVIRPALLWCDQRTEKQCLEITEALGKEGLIELVCNPAITGFTLPKLLWLRENESHNWARVATVLLPKDFIRLRLCGDKASDVADSSGTLMFDVQNRKWSSNVLSAFQIDERILPKVYESIEVTGSVSVSGASETGLKIGTPVVAGAGDSAAGAIGMGITRPGAVCVTIGTSGVVFAVTESPRIDLKGRIHTLCHAIPGRWHNTGVTQGAGLSLKWFRDNFARGITYDELGSDAANVPSGSDGAIWLPYLMGERTPHMDANARAAFVGLSASHTRGHLTRAVMEGVAFSLRDSIEIFRQLGTCLDNIRLGGGGARSAVWRQIQADVYGQSVEILEADEGAALGAAILAGVGVGAWSSVDEACESAIRVAGTVAPNAASVETLDRNYEVYRTLYSALRGATDIFTSREIGET